MPYSRPSLTALQGLVAGDIAAAVGGGDALLRFSNLSVMGRVQAGLANLHYGYLDWIAKQAVPFTCTDEYLEGWAALKGVYRKSAVSATGSITFVGAPGTTLAKGIGVVRSDGVAYTTTSGGAVAADGTVTVTAAANADPAGLTGAFGNAPSGTTMTLAQSIPGVQSGGVASVDFVGGQDLESADSLRSRMLSAFQRSAAGNSSSDYENWAKDVPGVTRAWCARNGFGPGTVVIYVMMDKVRASFGGFPQGMNGVATGEPRDTPATGDQLVVANYLFPLQPAVGLVYIASPKTHQVDLTLTGIPPALQAAVTSALQGFLQAQGSPGGTLPFGSLWSVITAAVGSNYVTVDPSANIVCAAGEIPVLGNITFAAAS